MDPWIGKYTVRPMEGMGSDAFSKASDGPLEKVGPCDFSFGGDLNRILKAFFFV